MNPQLLFLIGAVAGGASIVVKPLPLRALLIAVALGCYAIGGVEIAETASERAAKEESRR